MAIIRLVGFIKIFFSIQSDNLDKIKTHEEERNITFKNKISPSQLMPL